MNSLILVAALLSADCSDGTCGVPTCCPTPVRTVVEKVVEVQPVRTVVRGTVCRVSRVLERRPVRTLLQRRPVRRLLRPRCCG